MTGRFGNAIDNFLIIMVAVAVVLIQFQTALFYSAAYQLA